MLLFAAWFSAYSIAQHAAHDTHKADLGQIDLAIWNTAHGRLLQEIKDETVSTRLTDHVEPIFLPVSLIFWIWDDVRALLVLQAIALAAGAWPIFLLARRRLSAAGYLAGAGWGGLAIGVAHLLTPALQAAAVAEFHALPLAVPLIAWALWAVEGRGWGWLALATILLISVQEGMALLGALLGLSAVIRAMRSPHEEKPETEQAGHSRWIGVATGGFLLALSLGWFYVATFVIIPQHAAQVYALGQTPYAARYGALGASFGDVVRSLFTRPGLVLRIAIEPLRLRYLFGLLAPTAFIALLGPEILLLSAPLLLANLLSSFPFQYTETLHYSAPLAPYLAVAAAVGLPRLLRLAGREGETIGIDRWRIPHLKLAGAAIVVAALAYQISAGYLPGGKVFREAGGWPQVTAHDQLLGRYAAQIPADTPLTASTDLYPHLSHRELIYQFPWLGEATWALVDVSGTTNRHPNDVQAEVTRLMAAGWGVVDAADGYLLLAQGLGAAVIPDSFYDFARAPSAQPQFPLDITFGESLRLTGYDVVDDARWRRTKFRYYWRVLDTLPDDLSILAQVLAPDGQVFDDSASRPMPALVWHPPARWRAGETIVTETEAWYLPRIWAPVVTVSAGGQTLRGVVTDAEVGGQQGIGASAAPGGRVRLPAWARDRGRLLPFAAPWDVVEASAQFAAEDWGVALVGWSAPLAIAPGSELPVMMLWRASGPARLDYTVFLHLRDAAGKTVAGGDATPSWFTSSPTSQWIRAGDAPFETWSAQTLLAPQDLPAGRYDLVAGWYYWETGTRLTVTGELGNDAGNEIILGPVTVDAAAAPEPDLACLVAAEACGSQ